MKGDFWKRLKLMYFSPTEFFEKKGDKPVLKILLSLLVFYIIFYLFANIVQLVYYFISSGPLTIVDILAWLYMLVLNFVNPTLIFFFFVFLISGLVFLVSKLLVKKTKGKFSESLKPVSYAFFIWLIYSFVTLVVGLIVQSIWVISAPDFASVVPSASASILGRFWSGISQVSIIGLSYLKQPGALILSIVELAQAIHFIVFMSKGISHYHKITKGKSIAVSLISIALMMVIVLLLIIGYVYVASSIGSLPGA